MCGSAAVESRRLGEPAVKRLSDFLQIAAVDSDALGAPAGHHAWALDPMPTCNLRKHGVPFEYATRIFLDPSRLDREDTREDYGEERHVTLGAIEGRVFVVA